MNKNSTDGVVCGNGQLMELQMKDVYTEQRRVEFHVAVMQDHFLSSMLRKSSLLRPLFPSLLETSIG